MADTRPIDPDKSRSAHRKPDPGTAVSGPGDAGGEPGPLPGNAGEGAIDRSDARRPSTVPGASPPRQVETQRDRPPRRADQGPAG